MFTVVHPLALVASALWFKLHHRNKEGAIRLPEEDVEEEGSRTRGPREVDAEALWG